MCVSIEIHRSDGHVPEGPAHLIKKSLLLNVVKLKGKQPEKRGHFST